MEKTLETAFVGTNDCPHYETQKPLIDVIEAYLIANPNGGRAMTLGDFSKRTHISPPQISSLLSGRAKASSLSREKIELLAQTLGIPVLQVYILSGFIRTADAMTLVGDRGAEAIEDSYKKMCGDPSFYFCAPNKIEWKSWPDSAKKCLVLVYQCAMLDRLKKLYALAA